MGGVVGRGRQLGALGDLLELLQLDVLPLLASLVGLQLLAGVLIAHSSKVGLQPSQKSLPFLVKNWRLCLTSYLLTTLLSTNFT